MEAAMELHSPGPNVHRGGSVGKTLSRTTLAVGKMVFAITLTQTGLVNSAAADPIQPTITVLDTLGAATPTTVFSVFGSGGFTLGDGAVVGPRFDITRRTVLTEVGAFVNNCRAIAEGVPDCPNTSPLVVQIRPSLDGLPDPSRLLASFTLSHDDDPLHVSFESASMRLLLPQGSYFALFAAQKSDVGFLLRSALDPFTYWPQLADVGFLSASGVDVSRQFAPVRILGEAAPVPEPATLTLLSAGFAAAGLRKGAAERRKRKQARRE
jgi:hypothetical protein